MNKAPGLKLAIVALALLALVLATELTPLGDWLRSGVGGAWQGFLNLPGIAWAREQWAATSQGQEPGAAPSEGSDAIRELLTEGHSLQEQGKLQEALRRYREALSADQDYLPTHLALASLYLQLAREDEALGELERAAELAPDNTFVLGQLGRLYLKRDAYDQSIDMLERASKADPKDAQIRTWLGTAYYYRSYDDEEKALTSLERAAELAPEEAEVHYRLAMAYMRRDDEADIERAIGALERVIRLDPAYSQAYYYLGQLYMRADRREAAVAAWRKYLAQGDNPEWLDRVRAWLRAIEQGQDTSSGSMR